MTSWAQKQATLNLLKGRRVRVVSTPKPSYNHLIGLEGVVSRVTGTSLGVKIDSVVNTRSKYGLCWLSERDVEIVDLARENPNFNLNYDYVATVKLCNDSSGTEYKLALFAEDMLKLGTYEVENCLVIANIGGVDKRVVGKAISVEAVEDYRGITPTAEIVAVANISDFNQRCIKAQKAERIAQNQLLIEHALREQLVSSEESKKYYTQLSALYPDNEKLQALIADICDLYKLED